MAVETAEEATQRVNAKRIKKLAFSLRLKEKVRKESVPMKTGLRLKEKLPKKIMPRNHKNNVKTSLRLKEIMS